MDKSEVEIACWLTRDVIEYNYTVGTIHLSENNIFKYSGTEVASNFRTDGPVLDKKLCSNHLLSSSTGIFRSVRQRLIARLCHGHIPY